jgi:hypothetical protein
MPLVKGAIMNTKTIVINGIELNPEFDGITHINIYSQAITPIGRALSPFNFTPFYSSEFKTHFNSLEGFYHWLKTGKIHRELKQMYGYAAKQAGAIYPKVDNPNFISSMITAVNDRLMNNNDLLKGLMNTNLPLTHYYNYHGKVVYQEKHQWLADAHTAFRSRIQI